MTTMSERATLTYAGESTIEAPGSVHADPSIIAPGDVVELDADAAAYLLNTGADWQPAGPVPDGVLRGVELDEALEAAGLPRTGTAAEKRARLTEHEAALAAPTNDVEETNA